MEANFRLIQEMGWSRTEAQEALTAAGGNLQTALDWLLTNCPQGRVGTGEASPSPNTQGNKTPSNEIDSNWVPPPPLDSSDHENARHLEALKRNHSNDVLVHPDGEHGAPTQAPNRPASSSSPSGRDATSSGPSQSPTVDSEPIVLSAGTASSSSLVRSSEHPKKSSLMNFLRYGSVSKSSLRSSASKTDFVLFLVLRWQMLP